MSSNSFDNIELDGSLRSGVGVGCLEAPTNGIYIVLGEINLLLANLKRNNLSGNSGNSSSGLNSKYHQHHYYHEQFYNDPLSKNFYELKTLLNEHSDLNEIDSTTFMTPFLEVIKSEETSGPVTGMALTSVSKFISYGLIGINNETSATCVQQIADSITHARFVGTDSSSDEVVLMKILHVLRTLMLSPIGFYLTNSSVCEIMQSCFQICFENRLTELLRRSAESMLVDMVQLLFARLPQFNKEEIKYSASVVKKLTMKSDGSAKTAQSRQKPTKKIKPLKNPTPSPAESTSQDTISQVETTETQDTQTLTNKEELSSTDVSEEKENLKINNENNENVEKNEEIKDEKKENILETEEENEQSEVDDEPDKDEEETDKDYVNPRGVRFIQDGPNGQNVANTPYGLPCVRELLRFLISLINTKNSDLMISMGLNLITIGLESGIDYISSYQSLLAYVKDDLLKNLYNLLSTERMAQYASVLRVSFFLFESLRSHLKLQMEHFLNKLMDICLILSPDPSNPTGNSNVSSSNKVITQEQKEMTIDYFLQMLRIPGFAVEIYLNYDCSLNCSNLFENLTKLLSKNAFSVQSLLTANSLSLSALLTIIDNIELENTLKNNISMDRLNFLKNNSLKNVRAPPSSGFTAASTVNGAVASNLYHSVSKSTSYASSLSSSLTKNTRSAISSEKQHHHLKRFNRMKIAHDKLPKPEDLKLIRTKKRLMTQSVDLFNNTSPSKSIQFLKDNNLLLNNNINSNTDEKIFTKQLVKYLRETPQLDKRVMGEYLSNRKNNALLEEFINSFNFANLRIDEALRLFLETFRLPGEAPLISTIMEFFAKHWRSSNPNTKIANDDAAFTLAYAIIMLNVDQHNHNVKKQSTPMVIEEFKKNLSKVNNGGNFEETLLEEIYTAIKTDEIIMPAEHTGALRDNYLWKLLIRRQCTGDAFYIHAPAGSYNQEIFNIVWGQTISALSFVYDKSLELNVIKKTINGFRKCAQIAAHYMMNDVFDNIVIALCTFTTLQSTQKSSGSGGGVTSGSNSNSDALSPSFDSSSANFNEQLSINFGMNNKAQLACKTVFQLVHSHGDILRDGWKNILDCILQLYKSKLLPKVLIECEDYLNSKGRILLIKDDPLFNNVDQQNQKNSAGNESNSTSNSGLFSSFFPFMSSDANVNKGPTQEEQEAIKNAKSCIEECHIEQLIHDTKFLRVDSLLELIKALIFNASSQSMMILNEIDVENSNITSPLSDNAGESNSQFKLVDNDAAVFSLETLIKVVLQNRDRIICIWPLIRNHFYNIIISTNLLGNINQPKQSATSKGMTPAKGSLSNKQTNKNNLLFDYPSLFFIERTVVGLLRITARLLRREEIANEVLTSLRMLLLFRKKALIRKLSRQVTFGVHDLLRTNAANIHTGEDWSNIFTILQVYGAGANVPLNQSSNNNNNSQSRLSLSSINYTKLTNAPCCTENTCSMTNSDCTDRGYTSDSELLNSANQHDNHHHSNLKLETSQSMTSAVSDQSLNSINNNNNTILTTSIASMARPTSLLTSTSSANQYKIDLDDEGLGHHDKKAFAKCCETLTFLIRDMAHVSVFNFESCIHCLRTFVEACVLLGGNRSNKFILEQQQQQQHQLKKGSKNEKQLNKTQQLQLQQQKQAALKSKNKNRSNSPNDGYFNMSLDEKSLSYDYCDYYNINEDDDEDEDDQLVTSYETISIQLLDLLDTLHIKAASVFTVWSDEQKNIFQLTSTNQVNDENDLEQQSMRQVSNLWSKCWCPILQGIARLSCDINGEVRMHALQYLQRALLVHELQKLSAIEWEACFNKVLFPLLAKLLENIDPRNSMRMEETRMRASTLLCKVFLQHLTTLARLSTFTALWLTILDYMDKYIKSDKSDNLLHDVIPESLKNMLLVMETTGLFNTTTSSNNSVKFSQLSSITKDRIESFLPGLWEETFKINNKNESKPTSNVTTPTNEALPSPPVYTNSNIGETPVLVSDINKGETVDSLSNIDVGQHQLQSDDASSSNSISKSTEIKDI